jgi:glycerol-3-phosphate dehydrogenase (NAD(P)+)
MAQIVVVGAGSYGTCLAILTANAGHDVTLWAREPEVAAGLERTRENARYLPGYTLPANVRITSDLPSALANKEIVLGVTPSHAIASVFEPAASHLDPDAIVVNASKGLEEQTLDTIDQIYTRIFPARIAARATFLSGPTFATEIAAGMPAAIVLAGRDADTCANAQRTLSNDRFRIYTTDDVTGVLLGGALKNVVAIAAGVSDGLGFGSNARAALITRGLAEITRVGVAMGAHAQTFAGLSGMGDLVLTCSGDASRNRRVGLSLGQGKTMDEIQRDMKGMVAEGVKTTKVAHELAAKVGVPAPITEVMFHVIHRGAPARDTMTRLMQRALRTERDA